MSEEIKDVLTAFTVIVDLDGNLAISTANTPEISCKRSPTLEDVEMYCSHLSRQAARTVMFQTLIPRQEPTSAERISEALSRRSED